MVCVKLFVIRSSAKDRHRPLWIWTFVVASFSLLCVIEATATFTKKSSPLSTSTSTSTSRPPLLLPSHKNFKNTLQNSQVTAQPQNQTASQIEKRLLNNLKILRNGFGRRIKGDKNQSNSSSNDSHSQMTLKKKRVLGMNKIASGIPSYITDNGRLKRQLEGIFHTNAKDRAQGFNVSSYLTSTSTPKTPRFFSNSNTSNRTRNGSVVKRLRNPHPSRENGHAAGPPNNGNGNGTVSNLPILLKKGRIRDWTNANGGIDAVPNFQSNRDAIINSSEEDNDKEEQQDDNAESEIEIPQSPKGKRNFTVEIVEVSRKTVFNEGNDDNDNGGDKGKYFPKKYPPFVSGFERQNVSFTDEHGTVQNSTFFPLKTSKASSLSLSKLRPRMNKFLKKPVPVSGNFQNSPQNIPQFQNTPQFHKEKDSSSSATSKVKNVPSVKYRPKSAASEDLSASSTTFPSIVQTVTFTPVRPLSTPIPIIPPFKPFPAFQKPPQKSSSPVEVQIGYQEQIPYNDPQLDEADLKDYLEGYTTFGAKGGFKHKVNRSTTSSPFIPQANSPSAPQNSPVSTRRKKRPNTSSTPKWAPSRVEDVEVEQVQVKQRPPVTPGQTVYTATGVPILSNDKDDDDDKRGSKKKDKKVYEYSGNKEKHSQFPKLPKSTLDELYRQGHPAVAKAPPRVLKGNSLSEDYSDLDYNPFKSNPLVDSPPLKFDPESDTFYGKPTPDKHKLSQRNNLRPQPQSSALQVEHNDKERGNKPEYQDVGEDDKEKGEEEEAPIRDTRIDKRNGEPETETAPAPKSDENENENNETPAPANDDNANDNDNHNDDDKGSGTTKRDEDNDDDRFKYERTYVPPELNHKDNTEDEVDTFIKDFVSLDNNFESLPRPSADEETFRELIPPEADIGDIEGGSSQPRRGRGSGRERERNSDEDGEDSRSREEDDRGDRDDDGRSSSKRPPSDDGDYSYNDADLDNVDEFGPPTEDFDQSYVDALKQFDDEIKQIQEDEARRGAQGHHPPSSTPLVITSPGPSVSYHHQQRNAPSPMQTTTPMYRPRLREERRREPDPEPEQEREGEEEEGGDERGEDPPPDDRDRGTDQEDPRGNDDDTREVEEETEDPPPSRREEQEEPNDDTKDTEENETQQVKVEKVVEEKKGGMKEKGKNDKGGNLDEDISQIENEFAKNSPQS